MSAFELEQPSTLSPTNSSIVGVLPPISRSANVQASQIELRRVFPHAIELVDQMGAMRGWFSGLGVLFAAGSTGLVLFFALKISPGDQQSHIVDYAIFCGMILLGLLFVRVDGAGYDAAPILFNREAHTVSEFLPKVPLISLRRPTFVTATHDWACVRGEVMKTLVGGASNAHHEYALMLAVTDKPGGSRVVRRFRVGMSYLTPGGVASLWEYVRRYMQYEGAALTEKGMLRAFEEPSLPLWRMWFRLQPFLGPDVGLYDFKSPGFGKAFSILFALLAAAAFPVLAILGFGGWLANRLKTPMEWPEQIIADAGGPALTEEQARAKAKIYDH